MFWVQSVRDNDYYRICHGGWQNFKIARVGALNSTVKVFFKLENGLQQLIFEARTHEIHPIYNMEFVHKL